MSAEPLIQEVDLFEGWLRQYFSNGYDYDEILHFLDKNHNISISICTLLRKLKSYDLQRRHQAPLLNQLLELAKNYFTDPRFWFFEWLSLYLAYIK